MAKLGARRRRLAELETENAQLRAEVERLKPKPAKASAPVVKK